LVNADDILADALPQRRLGAFEKWLTEKPEIESLFWEVMERGYREQGKPFVLVLKAFLKHFPEAPGRSESQRKTVKALVDERFAPFG
jgi:hypothetical protein